MQSYYRQPQPSFASATIAALAYHLSGPIRQLLVSMISLFSVEGADG